MSPRRRVRKGLSDAEIGRRGLALARSLFVWSLPGFSAEMAGPPSLIFYLDFKPPLSPAVDNPRRRP